MARRIIRPVVVLPQPLSPTSPKILPWASAKLTPSTAFIKPVWRCKSPRCTGKYFFNPRTCRRASSAPLIIGLVPFLGVNETTDAVMRPHFR